VLQVTQGVFNNAEADGAQDAARELRAAGLTSCPHDIPRRRL
jgi:hypothetical protein